MPEIAQSENDALANDPVISQMSAFDHEQVVFCQDKPTGLKAIIAIHSTILGPSLGGTRMWNYNNEMEALNDVLRLSKGMSYKASITGLNLGGGKAVIIGDSYKDKSEAYFRRFGKFVESLGGKYITAEDVGISPRDIEWVSYETDYVTGVPESMGGSGDPSPVTAYGVYMGMKASAKVRWGSDSLEGKKVAVQGVGHVGYTLVDYLTKEGAEVYVNDINTERLKSVAGEFGAEVIEGDDIYDIDMDIYAPCALGATVNSDTIERLKCSVIAGAANNQLEKESIHGEALIRKGILYAPDFLINAGGLINVNSEIEGYGTKRAMEMTENIYNTTLEIFKVSEEKNIPTYVAANKMAEERMEKIAMLQRSM